jgi:hypothetical protein
MGEHDDSKATFCKARIDLAPEAIAEAQFELVIPNPEALADESVRKRANHFILVLCRMRDEHIEVRRNFVPIGGVARSVMGRRPN